MNRKEPCFAWPSSDGWKAFAKYYALLSLLWLIVYGGSNWVTALHAHRVRLDVGIDHAMPFVPAAAIVYLSLLPMTWMAPFVLPTRERIRSFAVALAVLYLVSSVGYLLLPGEAVRTRPTPKGAIGLIFHFVDWINLSYNYLPSLHTGIAVTAAWHYSQHKEIRTAALMWLWAAAIAASCLLMHEHYLVDLFAGAALALLISRKAPGA